MPAARRVKWDDWKDKVMLMAVFEQMNMTSPDFTRLSQVMCGDYSADALKNRFRALSKEAAAILRDRQRHAESREMTADTLPMMSGAVNGSDDTDVLVVREVPPRSELTPPPSEPSPTFQHRSPHPEQRPTISAALESELRFKCASCTPSAVLPRSNLPGSALQSSQ
ncbi:hypothetical protein CDV55_105493 [Aspergillus turcosus]|nr:hypothetical protein CDV55_105493 [Aspergillus turcosus]